MSLAVGSRIGPYEILSALGAGGMGEVYRARDTKLGRDVALKILPELFAADSDRIARFQREAKVLASLNHTNIAAIHALEESDGVRALVLELVEGPTLADRIAQGPIPIDEALPIAKQIAEALEAAHEQGVIHRDLKPANIKLRPDGTVKVLDFGLAKLIEFPIAAGSPVLSSQSPTITTPAMTQLGMILGTAAYMSPEQAKGRPADKRSDIWAFGCVLYEMLTGKRAFEGEDVSDTLASVLKGEPEWTALPPKTPPAIHRLLRRCLVKDRARRLSDAGVARLEIDDAPIEAAAIHHATSKAVGRFERIAWAVGLIATVVVVTLLGSLRRTPPSTPEMRFEITTTPPTTSSSSFAIAPSGQLLVYTATINNRTQLWLRALDSTMARALAGTDGAQLPFWSPDERSIGFFSEGKLKRIEIDGGTVQTLAETIATGGGTWSRSGTIVYSPNTSGRLFAVSQNGGAPKPVDGLITPGGHRAPQFLPDGRHFLYTGVGFTPGAIAVFVGDLDGGATRRLIEADYARYSSGHLLFVRQRTLLAQPFDPTAMTLTGRATVIAERLAAESMGLSASGSASDASTIIYRTAAADSAGGSRQFVWFDRMGAAVRSVGEPMDASNLSPAPDERHVVFQRTVDRNSDIWLADTERGLVTRLTSDPALDALPVASSDGRRVLFISLRPGRIGLYVKATDGSGKDEPANMPPGQSNLPVDWSHDGRFILYRLFKRPGDNSEPSVLPTGGKTDLWALPLDTKERPFPIVQTDFDSRDGQFSPDDKWIAYESDESGRWEIYLQRFPGPGGKERISIDGGTQVRWRRDGRELFYVALDGRMMAVPIRIDSRGDRWAPGTPKPLFATSIGGPSPAFRRQEYIVSADGQRFLINTAVQNSGSAPLTIIVNWKPKS